MAKDKRETYGEGSVHQHHAPDCPRSGNCKCRWRGTFKAGWTEQGKRRRITVSGRTESEARRRLRSRRAEIAKAEGQVQDHAAARMTVKAWSDQWLEQRVREVRPKTHDGDIAAVRRWIVPAIGTKRLVELRPSDVSNVLGRVRSGGLGQASVLKVRWTLIAMLRASLSEGYAVPAAIFDTKGPGKLRAKREALTVEEALAVLKEASALPHGTRYLVAFLQGLRQGEALGLTWDAVDLEEGLVTVDWQLQPIPYVDKRDRSKGFRVPDDYEARHLDGRFHLVRPKSDAGRRVIPLVPTVTEALRTYRDSAPPNRHGLVWARANGWPVDKAHDAAEFRALQDAVGVRHPDGRHYVGHEMRNTTATLLRALGVDELTITAILGHSSYLTSTGYMTVRLAEKREALEGVARMLGSGD